MLTMFTYALKRVIRSYKLFVALTIGVLLATTFFASTTVTADLLAKDALEGSMEGVLFDIVVNDNDGSNWTADTFDAVESELDTVSDIIGYTRTTWFQYEVNNSETTFNIIGLDMDSLFTEGFELVSGRAVLGPNETYIVSGSTNESLYELDDVVSVPITITRESGLPIFVQRNLTVAGIIAVPEDNRQAMLQQMNFDIILGAFGFRLERSYNIMLLDWTETIEPMLDAFAEIEDYSVAGVRNSVHITINRDAIIDPYDIENSLSRVGDVVSIIEARLLRFNVQVSSSLQLPLILYMVIAVVMNVQFIILAVPILFMSYFTGTMVSDVSYNLRRREIGLLMTKGYAPKSIRNMFLMEGGIVGGIAGFGAIFIGSAISYLVVGSQQSYLDLVLGNTTAIILSIMMGMFLGIISVWRPANRASKLEIVDALKQYIFVEETGAYKKLLPTIFLVLGTYKLIVWLLGVNVGALLGSFNVGNFWISLLIGIWTVIDGTILEYLAPLMFLWGATKVFMRGSLRFQEAIVNIGRRYFGAFGLLATRNVKRNPSRNAALVFVLALIVAYGVFTAGGLFSTYDRVYRNAQYTVGADVRVEVNLGTDMTDLISTIEGYDEVIDTTTEYRLSMQAGSVTIETRGIDPEEWSSTAFWEPDWFVGDLPEMLTDLGNDGIILSVPIANQLELEVGDVISVRAGFVSTSYQVRIVGLIGYTSALQDFMGPGGMGGAFSIGGAYPSFVSFNFLNESTMLNFATPNVLMQTATGVNGTAFQETIMLEIPEISRSYSVTAEMDYYNESPLQSGPQKMQWVAVFFAIILGSAGAALVIILTLREKDAETALFTVRGFTKWQLFKTLFAEMMIMVAFALVLGVGVGLIQIFGSMSQTNAGLTGLIRARIILDGLAAWSIVAMVGIVLIAAIIPIWWASRRPERKVDLLRA